MVNDAAATTHKLTPPELTTSPGHELVSIVKSGQTVCLLCYERDCACCHRSRIAEVVQDRTGIEVVDLAPQLF